MVASVQVMILNDQGKAIEKGDGIKAKDDWWDYVPDAEGKVVLKARDLANVVRCG